MQRNEIFGYTTPENGNHLQIYLYSPQPHIQKDSGGGGGGGGGISSLKN